MQIKIPNDSITLSNSILQHYLECEYLLHQFFQLTDFCKPNCITKPTSLYTTTGLPGFVGCCEENHHQDENTKKTTNLLLIQKRIVKYGLPNSHAKYCGYHNKEKGCTVQDHKPVICIGYACEDMRKHLRESFKINYCQSDILKTLIKTLSGELDYNNLERFKSNIHTANQRIRAIHQNPDSLETLANIKLPTLPPR